MRTSELNNGRVPVVAPTERSRRPLAWWLAVAAIGLAACGGSGPKKTVAQSTPTPTATTPTTFTTTGSDTKRPKRVGATKPATGPGTTKPATGPGVSTKSRGHATTNGSRPTTTQTATTTAAATTTTATRTKRTGNGGAFAPTTNNSASAVAMACLKAVGLNRARPGKASGIWEANAGNTSLTDLNAIVFVDGPYKTKQGASASAQSLNGVEYAASGGRWEVSASLPSHLSAQVTKVAKCLAGGGSGSKSYTF